MAKPRFNVAFFNLVWSRLFYGSILLTCNQVCEAQKLSSEEIKALRFEVEYLYFIFRGFHTKVFYSITFNEETERRIDYCIFILLIYCQTYITITESCNKVNFFFFFFF